MNSQLIVIVQVLIAATFVMWILSRRGSSPKPTVLNMSASSFKAKKYDMSMMSQDFEVKAKVLNVIFMWNGHSWDAYEVFGLPAGSPMNKVKERFVELQSKSDDGQRQFLSEALRAIENKSAAS
jgi:hypothetical protein